MFGKRNALFNAGFLSRRQTKKLLSTKHLGLCVNGKHKLSLEDSFRHCLVVGSTGSGKTSSFLLPTLLGLKKQSAVVTDPSGEIFAQTSGYLQRQGFAIQVINLADFTQSLPYNPLANLSSVTEVRKTANMLVKAAFPQSTGKDTFWNQGAVNILSIFINLLRTQPLEYQNLANVKFLADSFGRNGKDLIDLVADHADPDTYREYKSFVSQSENVLLSMLSTAKVALEKLSDPQLAQLTSQGTVDFGQLRRQPTILYLIVAEQSLSYYAFMLSLIYSQLFDMAMQPLTDTSLPIFFLLDEFAHSGIGFIDGYNTLITTIRKKRCAIAMIVQNLQQIDALFGRDQAASIIDGGCASHLFLSGQSQATAEIIERRLGRASMPMENHQGHFYDQTRSLMTADEVVQLPRDQGLLFHANLPAVLLKMRPFYQQAHLLRKTKLPAATLPKTVLKPVPYVGL